MTKNYNNQKGFALLLALLTAGIVLSIGLSLLSITLRQLDLQTSTRGSEDAFQAAAAGMDCLRHLRFEQVNEFTQDGNSINIDCLGQGGASVADNRNNNTRQRFLGNFDWTAGGSDRCIDFRVEVIDATGGADSVGGVSCDDGDLCTFMWVRGYNVSCGAMGSDPNAVTRELYAEF